HAERMASIRARVKASLEDKRPAVPLDEAIDRVKSRISQLARDRDDPAPRRRS
ncbi:type II toxin-antitoxin system ParD family antitoxin, partial [Mesorhizobium sp. M1D.F.Ca.ET.234.01.1.1]